MDDWTCRWSVVLHYTVCGYNNITQHLRVDLSLIMKLSPCFFRIKCLCGPQETFWSRPVLFLFTIQRIHQAHPSCIPSYAWICEHWHHHSPQDPCWSTQVGTLWIVIVLNGNSNSTYPLSSWSTKTRIHVTNVGREDIDTLRISSIEHLAIILFWQIHNQGSLKEVDEAGTKLEPSAWGYIWQSYF